MAKLSDMIKPSLEEQAAEETHHAVVDAAFREVFGDDDLPLNEAPPKPEESSDDDEDTEQQLAIAVDMLYQCKNYLEFFGQINSQTEILGDKSSEAMEGFIEELEDFLGDYTS